MEPLLDVTILCGKHVASTLEYPTVATESGKTAASQSTRTQTVVLTSKSFTAETSTTCSLTTALQELAVKLRLLPVRAGEFILPTAAPTTVKVDVEVAVAPASGAPTGQGTVSSMTYARGTMAQVVVLLMLTVEMSSIKLSMTGIPTVCFLTNVSSTTRPKAAHAAPRVEAILAPAKFNNLSTEEECEYPGPALLA